jgi:hypothetical protein
MLDTDTKRRIDTARDILVVKVPDRLNLRLNRSRSRLSTSSWMIWTRRRRNWEAIAVYFIPPPPI